MCLDPAKGHKILGQRLNTSQGRSPKNVQGISVSILKCSKCGLIYSNPQPMPSDIQDHYGTPPEEYWQGSYFNEDPNYFSRQIENLRGLMNLDAGITALDVGAGLGKCILAMERHGIESYGLEPSKPFYERAIEKMGINPERIKLGTIEDLSYPPESFDFITFGAVLEHLHDPASAIEKTMRWLKPNGIIHIEVPSSRHIVSKLINMYFCIRGTNYVTNLSPMHSPFHLFEFDERSFQCLLARVGGRIARKYYFNGPIYFVPRVLHPILNFWMTRFDKGMQLTVYLSKQNAKPDLDAR